MPKKKKREIIRFIEHPPLFKYVSIIFNELYKKRNSIKAMLDARDNI